MVNGRNTSELPHAVRTFGWLAAFFFCCPCICVSDDGAPPVKREGGQLVYSRDALGNQVPDFSHCGYRGGDQPIPQVPAEVTVAPSGGDSGRRLQAAIDYVAGLPADEEGFRGAVQLAPGKYDIRGQLVIRSAGVVLRGAGAGDQGTTLRATGNDRRTLIRIAGTTGRETNDAVAAIVDEYVPVGARQFRIDDASNLKVGDEVVVTRPSTNQWIKELGMDAFGVSWKPGTRDVRGGRTITAMNGQLITHDAPIPLATYKPFGGGTLAKCDWPGRITNIGIEDLQLVSDYSRDNPLDEEHAWHGVTFENARDGWVRRVEFRNFDGGAVAVWETADRVTVEDCISREPISEFAGYRRHTFFTQGGRTLFLRCWSEQGMHDFTVGHCAAGPNAFVNCYAADAHGDSGPIESWASGVLYDNVRIDGAGLNLENRWVSPPSAGWSAANSVIWQCQAATMRCFQPPTARNWVNGVWTRYAGDAKLWGESDFVDPKSLY